MLRLSSARDRALEIIRPAQPIKDYDEAPQLDRGSENGAGFIDLEIE
jgi:hypothetical protein